MIEVMTLFLGTANSLLAVPKVFPEAAQAEASFDKSMHPRQLRIAQDIYPQTQARRRGMYIKLSLIAHRAWPGTREWRNEDSFQ